ncbi:hypothetical protein BJX96DRAFT_146604 [Aspergillus floccosus]
MRARQLSNLAHEGGGMEEGQEGGKVRLEEIEDGLPDLDGQDGRIQHVQRRFGGIFGGGRDADGLSGALSLGTVPVAIAIVAIGHGGNVAFGGGADADGRGGVDTFTTGGFAGATGGIDAGVDTFDLAATAASASDARAHGGGVGARDGSRPLDRMKQCESRREQERRRQGGRVVDGSERGGKRRPTGQRERRNTCVRGMDGGEFASFPRYFLR